MMASNHQKETSGPGRKRDKGLGLAGTYLMAFAVCGWVVLMANMFGFARSTGWIFPTVRDVPGLAGSTVLLAFLALTPAALRQIFGRKGDPE